MSSVIGITLLLLVVSATCLIPARPSVALGLLITLYGVEQMLMAMLPILATTPAVYNYSVGVVSVLAIAIACYRFGLPRMPFAYLAFAAFFFVYTCVSALWTDAPITAREWLIHFVAEVPLCVLLPIFTLREYKDFRLPVQLVIAISTLVSAALLINPAQEVAGRTYLVGLATVLSPAELMGTGLLLLAALDRDTIGAFARVRWPISILMAIALFDSGARGQFLLAILLLVLLFLSRRFGGGFASAGVTALAGVTAAALILVLGMLDIALPRVQKERYSTVELSHGLSERLQFIRESLTLDKPIHGHGVGSWSYMHNYSDSVSKLDPSRITYPHNSLVHVYFELGFIGLISFVALVLLPIFQGIRLLRVHARDPARASLASGLLLFFLFSFGLSLKQNTYLAILGFYLSGAAIAILAVQARRAGTFPSGSAGPSPSAVIPRLGFSSSDHAQEAADVRPQR